MVNPVLDDKDRVLGKTEKGKEQFGGIEDRIFARGQEAGKTAIVKELLAIGDLSLEKFLGLADSQRKNFIGFKRYLSLVKEARYLHFLKRLQYSISSLIHPGSNDFQKT